MSLWPYGLLALPLWGYALVTFLTIQTMFLGVTLYLHRDQSHGGLILHRALRHVFRFWLWFSSGAVTRQWVAVHRRHHALADQQGDPHSPVVFGLRRVVFEGYELYKDAARDPETLRNYGRGTPEDWIERHLYSAHPLLGLVVDPALRCPGARQGAVGRAAAAFRAPAARSGRGYGERALRQPHARAARLRAARGAAGVPRAGTPRGTGNARQRAETPDPPSGAVGRGGAPQAPRAPRAVRGAARGCARNPSGPPLRSAADNRIPRS